MFAGMAASWNTNNNGLLFTERMFGWELVQFTNFTSFALVIYSFRYMTTKNQFIDVCFKTFWSKNFAFNTIFPLILEHLLQHQYYVICLECMIACWLSLEG